MAAIDKVAAHQRCHLGEISLYTVQKESDDVPTSITEKVLRSILHSDCGSDPHTVICFEIFSSRVFTTYLVQITTVQQCSYSKTMFMSINFRVLTSKLTTKIKQITTITR